MFLEALSKNYNFGNQFLNKSSCTLFLIIVKLNQVFLFYPEFK